LFQLDGQTLANCVVEHGISGLVDEIGEYYGVFFGENRRTVDEELKRANGYSDYNDGRNRDPSPGRGFFDLHLHPGMARCDDVQLLRHYLNFFRKPVAAAGHGDDVLVVLRSLSQSLSQQENVPAEVGLFDKRVGQTIFIRSSLVTTSLL
jgi:hypothetical protein